MLRAQSSPDRPDRSPSGPVGSDAREPRRGTNPRRTHWTPSRQRTEALLARQARQRPSRPHEAASKSRRRCRERNGPLSCVARLRAAHVLRHDRQPRPTLVKHTLTLSELSASLPQAPDLDALPPPKRRWTRDQPRPSTREVRDEHVSCDRSRRDARPPTRFPTSGDATRTDFVAQRSRRNANRTCEPEHRKMRSLSPRRNVARGWLASSASRSPSRGSLPFSEIRCADRCRDGLPHRHLPLSGFLTLTAAWSQHTLAALFRAASARRLSDLQSFFHQSQP